MKKAIFSYTIALLLFILTVGSFCLPVEMLPPDSDLKHGINSWITMSFIFLISCAFYGCRVLGEKLFDCLKEN